MIDFVGSDVHHQKHIDAFSGKIVIKEMIPLNHLRLTLFLILKNLVTNTYYSKGMSPVRIRANQCLLHKLITNE